MSFYSSISAYYDEIFSASPEAVDFFDKRCPPGGRILDIACGTGDHAQGLARLGHRVTGIDLDEAMIARAREKDSRGTVAFQVGDMLKIGALFPESGSFDLIYCIGNSLVHLGSLGKVERVLREIHGLLVAGGCMVVQIVNYDRILNEHIVELPEVRGGTGGLVFKRTYDYSPGDRRVQFKTELVVREQGEEKRIDNSIPLLILPSGTLKDLTARAGFRNVSLHGSFEETPYGPQSFALIISASKSNGHP